MPHRSLDAEAIAATIERLCQRVEIRFPGSGLARVCRELDAIAYRNAETTAWIARPILALRVADVWSPSSSRASPSPSPRCAASATCTCASASRSR